MTLRLKLIFALSALATLTAASIGATAYQFMAARLDEEINQSLEQAVANAAVVVDALNTNPEALTGVTPVLDIREQLRSDEDLRVTLFEGRSGLAVSTSIDPMPVTERDWSLAQVGNRAGPWWREVTVEGEHFKIVTTPFEGGYAVQAARRLDEKNRVLGSIKNRTLVSVGLATAFSALGGWLIANRATRRLSGLTSTATQVAVTGRLDVPLPAEGTDEVGQLGAAFRAMLLALQESREAQTRLVQDAGHELRTPLTSLRTNISLLKRLDDLDDETRYQILADLESEARELSTLVNEIVELATASRQDETENLIALDKLVEQVADRAARRTNRQITVKHGSQSPIMGRSGAIERAVSNLIDNATKFSPPESEVEVTTGGTTVTVCDRGIGISEKDLPYVFNRFHRATEARSRPGSGLGLAIVQAVALEHGGSVQVTQREGGGTCVSITFPAIDTQAPPPFTTPPLIG